MELQNVMRLFLALFLFTIWLTRRANLTPLYWGMAYLSMAMGSLGYGYGVASGLPSMSFVASLIPGLYVGLFWAGTQHFRGQRVHWLHALYLSAAVSVAILLALFATRDVANLVIGVCVLAVMGWAANVVWNRNRKYRIVAGIIFVQALVLFLRYSAIADGPGMRALSSVGYGLLVMGLAYVVLKDSNESIARQAVTDDLTGLPNRHVLLDRLEALMQTTPGSNLTAAALLVGVDNLHRTHELYGHQTVDRLLKELSQRMSAVAAGQHTLARYNHDEFVFVVTGHSPDDATRRAEDVAQRIVQSMQAPLVVGNFDLKPSVSIGIALSGKDAASAGDLVQQAMLASTQSRQADRNTWNFCNRELNDRAQRELLIEHKLQGALQNDELFLAFQPIVATGKGHPMVKAEALLRWTHTELGRVPPDEFIRIAERSRLIIDIGQWVLEEACRQVAMQSARAGRPVVVCVNVSVRQLRRAGFAKSVVSLLSDHGLSAHQLELEFTETIMIDNDAVIHAEIQELRALGLKLSLDDFGTGFSSLSYLTRFDFTTLKIDKSFVQMLGHDERGRRVVESICATGKSLGLSLVAEGVESQAQADTLTQCGVDCMQGFLFARPMAPHDFAEWLGMRAAA